MDSATLVFAVVAGLCGILAGLGGPGGILVIVLFSTVLSLAPASVAGTASAIFVPGTIVITCLYLRSGDVDWRIVAPLVIPTLIGTRIGFVVNGHLSPALYNGVLALLIGFVGANIVYRELHDVQPLFNVNPRTYSGMAVLGGLGLVVGVVGGLAGIGGPALTIPALLVLGVPALVAVGSGMAHGVVVTASTSVGYLAQGSVEMEYVLLFGVPFIVLQVIGWRIAHQIEASRLRLVVGGASLLLVPYLLF